LYARLTELDTLTFLRKQKLYCRKGFDKQFCKTTKRAIQKYVEDSLAEEIIPLKFLLRRNFMDIEEGAQELNVKA
jgi:hypothetical protein